MKMKILLIGGSRFVGPYLLESLLKRGHNLTVFNRGLLQSEYPAGTRFVKGDRNKKFGLKERFDAVIDMCAYSGAQTENALRQLRFDFFLHFSTAAVYKKTDSFPLSESSPLGDWPLWGNYNKGKVECERVLEKSGVKYASLRPVYILGPQNYRNREQFIYSKIARDEPITLPGNGEALAQFVFARDAAKAMAFLTEKRVEGAFNCAGNEIITLEDLVKEMAKIMGKELKICYNPEAAEEKFDASEFPFPNENFIVDNKKIKGLGIKFIPLLRGLKEDYENYYRGTV